jgi:ATP-dependent DNA helicase RecG
VAGRPEILFPLFSGLTALAGIGPKIEQNIKNLGVETPKDLALTLPIGVIDRQSRETVVGANYPEILTVEVEIKRHIPNSVKGRPYRIDVADSETVFQLVFFHARSEWLRTTYPVGERRLVSGKVEMFDSIAQMVHPDHTVALDDADEIPSFEPVYPLTAGVVQKTISKAATDVLGKLPALPEWIEPSVKAQKNWPNWQEALRRAHNPKSLNDVSPLSADRQRLAYDELFAHQLTLAIARANRRRQTGIRSKSDGKFAQRLLDSLPFKPTSAQLRAVGEVNADLASEKRMNRLLQGDVGSGKTLVALMAMLNIVEAGGQAVMMAPTEILARQHLYGLRALTKEQDVNIVLLTGRDKGAERNAKLVALKNGEISILLGTHAVFQKDVVYNDLRLAITDEQHKFGVRQRMDLGDKAKAVDTLVMTATPIPRSLALANYGDMDVSILDEKPPGRTPVKTVLISNTRIDEVTAHLKTAIEQGRQAYWVCPLVQESELSALTAAQDRFVHLRRELGEGVVGLVHGQLPPAEKDAAMSAFVSGETQVLVATTVIEVGVDVPNASIMVIEHAENFGLSQLHQLRGRVGRGSAESSCLLMYRSPLGETAQKRLAIMRETEDGFRIAEEDLALRGAGDVLGVQQSGLPKFRIADLESQSDLMQIAQDDARLLMSQDAGLKTKRGQAARVLLYLMEQDRSIRLISVG